MEEKIWVMELLDDVRRDAIRKSLGKRVAEQVYSAIIEIVKLAKVAGKEGLVALEDTMRDDLEAGKVGSELNNISILPMGIEHIVDGTEDWLIAEILTTKYWVKNPQGMEALTYYICIRWHYHDKRVFTCMAFGDVTYSIAAGGMYVRIRKAKRGENSGTDTKDTYGSAYGEGIKSAETEHYH